jgi:maltose O-acetyltransferase
VSSEIKSGVEPPKSQLQCMLDGDFYDASDALLVAMRLRARLLVRQYNATSEGPHERQTRTDILRQLLGTMPPADGSGGNPPFLEPSIRCDYGRVPHIHIYAINIYQVDDMDYT